VFFPSDDSVYTALHFPTFYTAAWGCGLPTYPPVLSRVVGGDDVRPHSWPWQISLESGRYGHWSHACGGTLISSEWVITAAHCILYLFTFVRIFLSLIFHVLHRDKYSYREEGALTISPAKIIKHYDYNSINDIAMLKLDTPVTFTDTIKPACLPEEGAVLPNGAPCYISGWGRLSTEGPGAIILQQALLPVVSYEICSQSDWWSFLLTRDMVVPEETTHLHFNFQGDSGGPLNCQNPDGSWAVHGVVSFGSGQGCNVVQKPTVFSKVSSYIDWINSVSRFIIFATISKTDQKKISST
uniref:Granzyme M n=1 Tax=Neogobius melanostomus TaxID=47308 RepID=A0A8C6TEC9_9GOBI